MSEIKNKIAKKTILISVLILFLIVPAVRKLLYYAADPVGEKNCPPLLPTGDSSKSTSISISQESFLSWVQKGGFINDASCLDRTPIYGMVQVKDQEDVKKALLTDGWKEED